MNYYARCALTSRSSGPITKKLEGPTSLLTNTIRGKLEEQLEDRLDQIHPNSSDRQTQAIISQTAEIASGQLQLADEKIIIVWKRFYRSLESVDEVNPFAPDIKMGSSLPLTLYDILSNFFDPFFQLSIILHLIFNSFNDTTDRTVIYDLQS